MQYLLDSCAVSDFFKHEANTVKKIKSCSPHDICVSTITIAEIEYGLANNPAFAHKHGDFINHFLSQINVLYVCEKIARLSGIIRARLRKAGTPIGMYDILIGATALHNGLCLITSNVDEFRRIDDLRMENWRTP